MASAGAGNWRSTAVTWESFRKTTMIGHAQQRGAAPSYLKISRTSSGILADGRPLLRWSRFDEAVPQVAVWLATEDKKGISNLSGDIMTPQTIDPNYVVGFVWTRQYGVRLTKTFNHAAFGIAAENPQLLLSPLSSLSFTSHAVSLAVR